jgi:hypothetical protein
MGFKKMKYLKTYEAIEKDGYKYLDEEDTKKLEHFVREFVNNSDWLQKIDELTIKDYDAYIFDLFDVWESLFKSPIYGKLKNDNIYYAADIFCVDNGIDDSTPAIRNTLFDIIRKLYDEYDAENKIYNRLITILEENPELFDKYEIEMEEAGIKTYIGRSRKSGLWDMKKESMIHGVYPTIPGGSGFKEGDIVECINNYRIEHIITIGKYYEVLGVSWIRDTIEIISDEGVAVYISCERFKYPEHYNRTKKVGLWDLKK